MYFNRKQMRLCHLILALFMRIKNYSVFKNGAITLTVLKIIWSKIQLDVLIRSSLLWSLQDTGCQLRGGNTPLRTAGWPYFVNRGVTVITFILKLENMKFPSKSFMQKVPCEAVWFQRWLSPAIYRDPYNTGAMSTDFYNYQVKSIPKEA